MLPEKLMTAKEVAELLQVSEDWVYLRARTKQLPAVRVGGIVRFRPSDVRAVIGLPDEPRTVTTLKLVGDSREEG